MTTIDEHAAAVARLVREVAGRRPRALRMLPVAAAAVGTAPHRYRARVLAADVRAREDVPRFDNSQMDGFALRSADLVGASAERPVELPVGAPVAAGDEARPLPPGTAVPVMTGAPIPTGADAVVPVERTEPGRFDVPVARFAASVAAGTFVRPRGVDAAAGDLLARAGDPLRIAHLGAFAAAGVDEVAVAARLRVLVITTGRELQPAGEDLGPGRIRDAIGGMLAVALAGAGARVRTVVCPSDDPDRLWDQIAAALGETDVIVTVGGVSKGAYEVVKLALAPRGIRFDHVAMQPGGPQGLGAIAADAGSAAVVCLPGNPVSALISFEAFLRPVLRELAGLRPHSREATRATLTSPLDSPAGQHQIRRGILREGGLVQPLGGPGSHLIAHYGAADTLIHVPVGVSRFEAGDDVEVWPIDD